MDRKGRGIDTTAMDHQADITPEMLREPDDLEVLLGGRAVEEEKRRRAAAALGAPQ